jgi:hypothetical protein
VRNLINPINNRAIVVGSGTEALLNVKSSITENPDGNRNKKMSLLASAIPRKAPSLTVPGVLIGASTLMSYDSSTCIVAPNTLTQSATKINLDKKLR